RHYRSRVGGGVTYDEFVKYLDQAGVGLCLRGGEIVVQAPDEVLTDELRELTRKHRHRLVHELKRATDVEPGAQSSSSVPSGGTALSWFQERLWLLHARNPEDLSYNIPILLALDGPLDLAALERSLRTIVERQESLRTVYRVGSDGTPR